VTAAAGALREVPFFAPERAEELLREALDEKVLLELGWDAEALVVRRVIEHPSFGVPECEVEGCAGLAAAQGMVCVSCRQRFGRWRTAGRCGDLEEFKRIPRRAPEPPELCAVCCVPPDHMRPAHLGGLCRTHATRRSQLGLTVEEYVTLDGVVSLPTFGVCRRTGCGRLAAARVGLCWRCDRAWSGGGRPDLAVFCTDPLVEGAVEVAPISLAGLAERVRLELLFVAQRFSLQGRRSSRPAWRRLVRDARTAGVASLLELAVGREDASHPVLVIRRMAQRELEVLYADPEAEFASDVWDLRKAGVATEGRYRMLDFSPISQEWLRAAAKRWAACRASYTRTPTFREMLAAVSLLSESLRLREDGGREKAELARADARAFVERVGRLHRSGRVADETYTRSVPRVRHFLRECRDFGLYEPGEPLHRLSADFAVWQQDVPKRRKEHDAGSEGRALPQVVIDQLLSEVYLDRLREGYSEDACMMLQILADTGRRPDELAKLIATCLDRTEFIDEQTGELQNGWVLVHDMPKVAIKDFRLFIARSTAELIIAQRERVAARYPKTPLSRLRLFPRRQLNPEGIEPTSTSQFDWVIRRWMSALPELIGPSGEPFPRERVTPYAFRHSFAQRHADNGTPIDVLAAMMGHHTIDTTRGYYTVNKTRMRKAVATVSEMQLNHRGNRVTTNLGELVDAEYDRYQIGQIAVAFGTCHEPSNVKSSGQSCPYRFRCFGCTHFRTDPSYLPELREHLQRLLVDHERLNTATDGMLEDWARRDALPAPAEIVAVRRLIRAAEAILDGLTPEERGAVDELFAVIRRARANIETALPTHFSAVVRQPRPTLYPQSTIGAGAS
jgi:integrase